MSTIDYSQLEKYMLWMEEHGRRSTTIHNNRASIRMLLRLLKEAGRPTDVYEITPEDMVWLDQNLGVKESSRGNYLHCLNGMIQFYTDRDVLRKAGILRNRAEDCAERVFITKGEFYTLYDAAAPEMRMALVLGAFMGLRRMEMASVRESEIADGRIPIHGKGHGPDGLTISMAIPRPVLDEMARFKAYRREVGTDTGDDHILQFMDHNGKWHGCKPETIGYKIRDLGIETGIRVTSHSLRRLYATTLYNECNVDLETLRRMMRHADVNTTLRCYVNADPSKMSDALDKICAAIEI